nr:disease resistance protein Pik-2-like [Lolium perenne]
MVSLLSKLGELVKEEYELQNGVKDDVEFLRSELTSIHAALRVVAEVPWDQLEEQVRIWAEDVRDLSYAMENALDTFLVRVEDPPKPEKVNWLKKKIGDMSNLLDKGKLRHEIGKKIRDIKEKVKEVADRLHLLGEMPLSPTHSPSRMPERARAAWDKSNGTRDGPTRAAISPK